MANAIGPSCSIIWAAMQGGTRGLGDFVKIRQLA